MKKCYKNSFSKNSQENIAMESFFEKPVGSSIFMEFLRITA